MINTILAIRFPITMSIISGYTAIDINIYIGLIALSISLIDILKRSKEYLWFKNHVFSRKYSERIINRFVKLRCQRDAMLFAAKHHNLHIELINHYKSLGYKWYHILPDDNAVFTFQFWKSFFTNYP